MKVHHCPQQQSRFGGFIFLFNDELQINRVSNPLISWKRNN